MITNFMHDNNTEQYLQTMSALNARCGDIYRVTARNRNDFIIAERYYDRAFKLCSFCSDRNMTHAKLLDQHLDNWEKAEIMYEMAHICEKGNRAYQHYAHAMALMYRKCFDKSIAHFKEAIKYKGRNARYYAEYGFCLFSKGPQYYCQSLQIFEYALQCANNGIQNGRGNHNYTNLNRNQLVITSNKRIEQIKTHLKTNPHIINIQKTVDDITIDNLYRYKLGSNQHKLECVKRYYCTSRLNKVDLNANIYEQRHDLHDDDVKYQSGVVDNVDEVKQRSEQEFDKFWKSVHFDSIGVSDQIQQGYRQKFRQLLYNSLSIVQFIDKNTLINEIGMNENYCNCFLNKIKLFEKECKKFNQWLKHHDLYDLYIVKINKYSIYTLESLKNFISNNPNNWKVILQTQHKQDCWNIDAKLIFSLLPDSFKV